MPSEAGEPVSLLQRPNDDPVWHPVDVVSARDQMWDQMPAVGREFGSPDFERLMEEDYRLGRGVFDPAVLQAFQPRNKRLAGLDPPEDFQPQPRMPS